MPYIRQSRCLTSAIPSSRRCHPMYSNCSWSRCRTSRRSRRVWPSFSVRRPRGTAPAPRGKSRIRRCSGDFGPIDRCRCMCRTSRGKSCCGNRLRNGGHGLRLRLGRHRVGVGLERFVDLAERRIDVIHLDKVRLFPLGQAEIGCFFPSRPPLSPRAAHDAQHADGLVDARKAVDALVALALRLFDRVFEFHPR